MKKISFCLLFFILISILYCDWLFSTSHQAIMITDDCKIGIDINHNDNIKDDEFYDLDNIRNFCSDENILENEKIIGNLSEHEKLYFKIISKSLYEKIFLTSLIRLDNDKISVNLKNAEKIILSEGLALPKDNKKPNKKYISKILEHKSNAKKEKIYLLNLKSMKYHKIDCEKGLSSVNQKYILPKELPKNAKKCNYCFYNTEHYKIFDKNNKNEFINKFYNILLFEEIGSGILKPNSNCDNQMCKQLLYEINNAKHSIDMTIYDLRNQPKIVKALKDAKNRGIKIRVVTDNKNYTENKETINNIKTFSKEIYDDNSCYKESNRLMHNKFIIFDNEKVWTGSTNFTNTGLSGFNANNSILISSKEIVSIYLEEFNNFINNKYHNEKKRNYDKNKKMKDINVYFSPQDKIITKEIIPEIKKAKEYIYIPTFIITDKTLSQELINAQKRGVEVKLIIDATNARNKYSQHTFLRQNNIEVKTENYAGKMHMKTIIIDDRVVFIGSMNFTKSGNLYNDENCIKIIKPEIVQKMKETFLIMWSKIPDKYLIFDPSAESQESIGSCFDGIDNDFDEKIDFADSSCKIQY